MLKVTKSKYGDRCTVANESRALSLEVESTRLSQKVKHPPTPGTSGLSRATCLSVVRQRQCCSKCSHGSGQGRKPCQHVVTKRFSDFKMQFLAKCAGGRLRQREFGRGQLHGTVILGGNLFLVLIPYKNPKVRVQNTISFYGIL